MQLSSSSCIQKVGFGSHFGRLLKCGAGTRSPVLYGLTCSRLDLVLLATTSLPPVLGATFTAMTSEQSQITAQLPRGLQDCSDWLNAIPAQEITQSKPLQRLRTATTVLQKHSSRQQREEVQQLLDSWGVPQKSRKRKRSNDVVKADLLAKVIEETRRLQRMQDAAETSAEGARFSAIKATLRKANAQR